MPKEHMDARCTSLPTKPIESVAALHQPVPSSGLALDALEPSDLRRLDEPQIDALCDEIRAFLIESVSQTGGHLASNLGVVELTVALHRAFDSPKDKIIWDVGHQSYVHKILTGRGGQFATLRQKEGVSGFPRRDESPHDPFNTGHSSTSLSAAMGMACAREQRGESHHVVGVIGDGALTGGMVYEALNHIGSQRIPLIIVLNDNNMSISHNVGSVHYLLSRVRSARGYIGMKRSIATRSPGLARRLERLKNAFKYALLSSAFFEELGIKYLGPIDGHNVRTLETMLERAKNFSCPVLLHAITTKGKGFSAAENNPEKFHGIVSKEAYETNKLDPIRSNSACFGEALCAIAERDPSVVALTAAMPSGTGLKAFAERFPSRFFDVGIAEPHAVTLAAGMAAGGLKPVFAVYSTFLQRAYDQTLHDVCLQELPVVFAVDRAGPVGEDGPTHHGVYDIGFLTQMPGMTVYAPATQDELVEMLGQAIALGKPAAIRYPRNALPRRPITTPVAHGKWEIVSPIEPTTLIATGDMLPVAIEAASQLRQSGNPCGVVNARFLAPLDTDMLARLRGCHTLAVLEAGILNGGLGEHCLRQLADPSEDTPFAGRFHAFGVPDSPLPHASVDELYEMSGLTAAAVVRRVRADQNDNLLRKKA